MFDLAATSYLALFVVQAIGTLIYLILISRLFSRLETRCGEVWQSLGRPSLFLNNSIRNNGLVLRWLWSKEFLGLRDREIVRLAGIVRVLFITLLITFAILVAPFLIGAALALRDAA